MRKKLTIHTDGEAGFWKRSLDRARKMDTGESPEPERSVTIAASALKVLTPARLALLSSLLAQRDKETSITSLAERLKRPREAVSRDLKALRELGLICVRELPNPGHGRVTMVSPAARKVLLEL